ncbi:MAG: sugar phosphate isomerase/epimerase [Bacteroidota bacterium]|nr:sugar phosphate isomerase/epimerase [Bacteroidota bacterium]
MNISRRTFIKNGSIAITGAAFLPASILDKPEKTDTILGIQLWTVRDEMEKDPAGILKKLAKMGYRYVEHAGYQDRKFYGYTASEFKKLLNDLGLKMDSGHSFFGINAWDKTKKDFTDEWKYTVEDAAAVGMKYLISPGVEEVLCKNMDDFKWYMDFINKNGALCKKGGVTFGYHNEDYEFNHKLDDTVIYDLILQMTDKSLVCQQIDICNMYEFGGRAMDYLKRYPGRFLLMHVKDEVKRSTPSKDGQIFENTILGKGIIGVKPLADFARKTGTKYFIIEQESYQDKTPLECAYEDLKVMQKWGY